MAFPHRYTAINHYLIRIMNNPVNNGFADCSIAFIPYPAVPASRFKLRTKDNRSFYNHYRSAGGRNGHFDIAQGGQHDWNSWAPQLAAMAPDMTATIR